MKTLISFNDPIIENEKYNVLRRFAKQKAYLPIFSPQRNVNFEFHVCITCGFKLLYKIQFLATLNLQFLRILWSFTREYFSLGRRALNIEHNIDRFFQICNLFKQCTKFRMTSTRENLVREFYFHNYILKWVNYW